MSMIKATAYPNALTKEENDDYYGLLDVTGTLDLHDIVQRLRDKEIATKNVDGEAFCQNVFDEMATASAEGYNIVTPFFHSFLSMQAVVKGEDLGHPLAANRMQLRVKLNQGEGAKKAIAKTTVYIKEQSAASGPLIQSAMTPTVGKANTLTAGEMVLIQGMRLALKGDNAGVGITFIKAEDEDDRPVIESENSEVVSVGTEVFVRPTEVYPNTPSSLQFILPAQVSAGNWRVMITTQASSASNVLTKEPRSYVYNKVISVERRKM